MAGTGQGALQPTKLVQTDDFMETIAPPGYQQDFFNCADSHMDLGGVPNAASVLFVVPDGLSAEIVDIGVTWPHAFTFTTVGPHKVSLQFAVVGADGAATQQIVDAFDRTTAVTAGLTLSTGRGSMTYSTASDDSTKRTLAAGSIVSVGINQTGTTGAGAGFVAWVRLKWTAKDTGDI